MVNEFMTFSAACQAQGVKFPTSQAEHVHEYSPEFRNLLTGMHIDLFVEIGANPAIGKDYVEGVAVKAIRKLGESDQWDKVAIPLKLLSDILGLTKETADVPVIANLTQTEIDELRAKFEADAKQLEETAKKVAGAVQVVIVDGQPN